MSTGPAREVADRFSLVGATLGGKFRIERVVAEGGFGLVYAAEHLALRVPVALKVLKVPDHLSEKMRKTYFETFAREAQTMARVRHANIVQVFDTGVDTMPNQETAPWMALEWLEGRTLQEEIDARRKSPFLPAECLALLRPVFDALATAHEMGVAHRDLKPANVMLAQGRKGVVPRVLDFGIAKEMDDNETAGSGVTRTAGLAPAYSPAYAAPEQVSRTRTGPWTDVHALGLILTEMITGRAPYGAREMTDLMREVLREVRPTPAKFGVDAGAWEAVIARAVAYRPQERFASAAEMLAALESASLPAATGAAPLVAPAGVVNATGPSVDTGGRLVTDPGVPAASAPAASVPQITNALATGPQNSPPNALATGPQNSPQIAVEPHRTMSPAPAVIAAATGPAPVPSRRMPLIGLVVAAVVALGVVGVLVAMRRGDSAAKPAATVAPVGVNTPVPSSSVVAVPAPPTPPSAPGATTATMDEHPPVPAPATAATNVDAGATARSDDHAHDRAHHEGHDRAARHHAIW